MNIEEIKEKLPSVKVKIGGKVWEGRISGRKEKFATVIVPLGTYPATFGPYQYAWETIKRHLDTGKPLTV